MEGVLGHEVCHLRHNTYSGSEYFEQIGHEHTLRIMGDVVHLCGVWLLCTSIYVHKSSAGISLRSQELFLLTYLVRYFNPLHHPYATVYRLIFAAGFIIGTAFTMLLVAFGGTNTLETYTAYPKALDKFPHAILIAVCGAFAMLNPAHGLYEHAWIFGVALEGVALMPQVMVLQATTDIPNYVVISFYCLGSYPLFYFMHYITNYHMESYCQPMSAIVSGVIQLAMLGVGMVAINGSYGAREGITRSAITRLHKMRGEQFGLEGEQGLTHLDQEAGSRTEIADWVMGMMDISKLLETCGRKWAPDLSTPDDSDLDMNVRKTQRGGIWLQEKRSGLDGDVDNSLWNLLPFKLSSKPITSA